MYGEAGWPMWCCSWRSGCVLCGFLGFVFFVLVGQRSEGFSSSFIAPFSVSKAPNWAILAPMRPLAFLTTLLVVLNTHTHKRTLYGRVKQEGWQNGTKRGRLLTKLRIHKKKVKNGPLFPPRALAILTPTPNTPPLK